MINSLDDWKSNRNRTTDATIIVCALICIFSKNHCLIYTFCGMVSRSSESSGNGHICYATTNAHSQCIYWCTKERNPNKSIELIYSLRHKYEVHFEWSAFVAAMPFRYASNHFSKCLNHFHSFIACWYDIVKISNANPNPYSLLSAGVHNYLNDILLVTSIEDVQHFFLCVCEIKCQIRVQCWKLHFKRCDTKKCIYSEISSGILRNWCMKEMREKAEGESV